MSSYYDNFDDLFDLYDEMEPEIRRGNYMYCLQHYGDKQMPRRIHVTVTDLSKVPEGANDYDEKYEIESIDVPNSIEFINKFKLCNGKTIAEEMCDANGWDYSILPVFPKWYSPLFGDSEYPESEYRYIEEK